MAEGTLVPIFDSVLGVNTVDSPKSDKFQPASKAKPEPPFLTRAENVVITRTGRIERRPGRTKRRTLTRGHSGWGCELGAFYADGDTLYQFNPYGADTALATGIHPSETISFAQVADQVFWTNGRDRGWIHDGSSTTWGMTIADPPTLNATSGGLRAGRYRVAVVPVSAEGIEGGCREASTITLTDTGGILVTPNGIDPSAAELDVFVSDTNGSDLFYARTVSVGAFSITSVPDTAALFEGMGGHPPPSGHIVREWGGYLIVASDNALYFSEPGNPHRFRIATDVQMLPARCVMLEPMADGFFYAVEGGGTFWVQGTDPHKMTMRRLDDRLVAEQRNSVRVPASKIPWLQSGLEVPVPVWATQDGWAVGLPGGTVRHPVEGRVAMDAMKAATGAYVEQPSLKQLLLSMRDKQMASRAGFGDQMTLTVTRGGVPIA